MTSWGVSSSAAQGVFLFLKMKNLSYTAHLHIGKFKETPVNIGAVERAMSLPNLRYPVFTDAQKDDRS